MRLVEGPRLLGCVAGCLVPEQDHVEGSSDVAGGLEFRRRVGELVHLFEGPVRIPGNLGGLLVAEAVAEQLVVTGDEGGEEAAVSAGGAACEGACLEDGDGKGVGGRIVQQMLCYAAAGDA